MARTTLEESNPEEYFCYDDSYLIVTFIIITPVVICCVRIVVYENQ